MQSMQNFYMKKYLLRYHNWWLAKNVCKKSESSSTTQSFPQKMKIAKNSIVFPKTQNFRILFLSKNTIYAKLLYEKIRKNIYCIAIIDDSRKCFVKNQNLPALLNHFPKKWKLSRVLLSSRSTQTQNFRILNRNRTKKEWGLCL